MIPRLWEIKPITITVHSDVYRYEPYMSKRLSKREITGMRWMDAPNN